MLLAVCADRGAPGSTTTALALAAARGLPSVVVEADPYGGDLALRLHPDGSQPLPATPTVLGIGAGRPSARTTLRASGHMPGIATDPTGPTGPAGHPRGAAGGRSGGHRDLWRQGAHELSELVRVVPGFLAAEHGSGLAWPVLAAALSSQTVPVFADVGRVHAESPSMPLVQAADAVIAVCRADMASVKHLVDRLELLVPVIAERNGRPPVVVPVVLARRQDGAKAAGAVADLLAQTVVGPALRGVGWLAWDPGAVALLESGADPWSRPLAGTALMGSARRVIWLLCMAVGLDRAEPRTTRRGRVRWQPDPASNQPPSVDPTADSGESRIGDRPGLRAHLRSAGRTGSTRSVSPAGPAGPVGPVRGAGEA